MTILGKMKKSKVIQLYITIVLFLIALCIAGFAYEEERSSGSHEALVCELQHEPTYNQKTDPGANLIYLTTTQLNVRQSPEISGKLMGTIDPGVSVTILPTEDPEWGFVKEFNGYTNMAFLSKVPVENVIGVLYTKNDMGPYLVSQPDDDYVLETIDEYKSYLTLPVLYNDKFYKVGDSSYINKEFVVTEYYEKEYYNHFVKMPTSRGFTEYKPPAVFHSYSMSNTAGKTVLSESDAYRFFKSQGYDDVATAGILGNLKQEHGFKTTNAPLSYNSGHEVGGLGLCQWTYGRAERMKEFAYRTDREYTDASAQLEFIMHEIHDRGYYMVSPENMNGFSDPGSAAIHFNNHYESGTNGRRAAFAYDYYERIATGDLS